MRLKDYMAKKTFHDPIAPRYKEKSINNPWPFTAPTYDDRGKVEAGTNCGVGFKNPIGHKGAPKQTVPTLPRCNVPTLKVGNRNFDNIDVYE